MNNYRNCLRFAGLALLLQLNACTSAPEYLYTLEAASAPTVRSQSVEQPSVLVGPVTLPELIDRPQLVIRNGEYGIVMNEQQRWATPLKEALPRVIAAELGDRLSKQNFVAASAAVVTTPVARLLIDITGFDLSPQGANLVAHWAYRPTDTQVKPIEGVSQALATVKAIDYIEYVDAARRATLAIADDIAGRLAK